MATIKQLTARQLAESTEIKEFHRVLAIKHSNSIQRVLSRGGDTETIIKRAKKEIKLLLKTEAIIEKEPGNLDHKCPPGRIWDEALQACVPIDIILE